MAEGGSQAIADALAADLARHGGTDRDRRARHLARRPAAERRADARRVAVDRGRHPRRPPAAPRRPRLPPVPSRPRRVQGRLRDRGRRARGRPRRRAEPARCTSAGASTRSSPPSRPYTAGRCPTRPFVLVGQQYLADPGRSVGDVHPLWTLRPRARTATPATPPRRSSPRSNGSPRASASAIVGTAVRSTTEMSAYNPNYVGGDIIGGASSLTQLLFRPAVRGRPVLHRRPGHVPVLGLDAAGRGRARHVRRQRRRPRTRPPGCRARTRKEINRMNQPSGPRTRNRVARDGLAALAAVAAGGRARGRRRQPLRLVTLRTTRRWRAPDRLLGVGTG